MDTGSRRVVIAAFFANLGIAAAKFTAFVFTGAASMLAEAAHSVADTGNQGLLMLGALQARHRPTPRHPFGFSRARYFWAFVVALVLFTMGGIFAILEGIAKLRHPHAVESPGWAFATLAVAVALESVSLRTAVRAASPHRRGRSWWRFVHESKNPELSVVLLEDLGALLGLAFALAGVTAAVLTGEPRFDAAGSLAIGILLVAIAAVLMVEMRALLIGEAADPAIRQAIREALVGDGVTRVIHLRTEHLGPDDLLVAAKVELARGLTLEGVAAAIDGAEARVRAAVPVARFVYLEPDVYREPGREARDAGGGDRAGGKE